MKNYIFFRFKHFFLSVLVLIFVCYSLFSMKEEGQQKNLKELVVNPFYIAQIDFDPLNLVIILDDGGEEVVEGLPKAMTQRLEKAIKQNQNILVNLSLVSNLIHLKKIWSNEEQAIDMLDNTEWSMYITQDKKFCLFLYEQKKNLKELGFNDVESFLSKITYKNLKEVCEEINKKDSVIRKIDFDTLKNVFLINNSQAKFICLAGHGGYDQTVAALPFHQYDELLRHFERIGCKFLFVTTCFSGGSNLIKAHKNLLTELDIYESKRTQKYDISFPLVVEGITDSPTTTHSAFLNYQKYFADLNQIFGHEDRKKNSWIYWSERPFSKIITDLSGSLIENFPQVRLPNSRGYFTPSTADKSIELITYSRLLEHEITKGKNASFETKATHKAVLLYPSVLKIPLIIQGDEYNYKLPSIISMIPGNAQHYIEELIISNFIDDFEMRFSLYIQEIFVNSEAQKNRSSSKLFFIKKITYFEENNKKAIENVVVVTQPNSVGKFECLLFCQNNNELLFRMYNGQEWQEWIELNKEEFNSKVGLKLKKTMNADKALFQSSGGRETWYTFCNAIKGIFPDYVKWVNKFRALMEAFEKQNYEEAIELVKHKKISLCEYQKEIGNSFILNLLMHSAETLENKIKFLQFFVEYGADVNYQDDKGDSFLHQLAAYYKDEKSQDIIRKLIPALVKAQSLPFKWDIKNEMDGTPLYIAVYCNNIALVEMLLEYCHVNIKEKNFMDGTPLDGINDNRVCQEIKDLLKKNFEESFN